MRNKFCSEQLDNPLELPRDRQVRSWELHYGISRPMNVSAKKTSERGEEMVKGEKRGNGGVSTNECRGLKMLEIRQRASQRRECALITFHRFNRQSLSVSFSGRNCR